MNICKFTDFEIVSLSGVIALGGDFIWLTHDLIVNGVSITYLIIAIGLGMGIVGTLYALRRHYKTVVSQRKAKTCLTPKGNKCYDYWIDH